MGGWLDLYMSRYIILLLFIGLAWGQDCTADDGTDGIELWDECYSIENTDSLDLSNSGIADSIPSEIGNLINLIYLDLSSNILKSAIPTSIGNLINLRHLDLSDNRETFMWSTTDGIDSIPSEIGNLTNLESLDLSFCYINYVPSEIGNLTNLENLNLKWNQLTDFDLSIFTNLINLKKIDLSVCGIIGQLGSEFENLTNLEYLKLSGNQFTGIIPSEIWNFENLKALELGGFFIMGAGVLNSITGTIPDEVGNLINLKKLDLSNNEFSGEIPSSLFNLDSLDTLFLGENSFSGTLSESICNFIEDSNSVYSIGGNKLCPPYPSCIQDDDLGFQYISDCDSACGEGEVQLWTGCYPIDSTFELTIDNLYNLDIDSLEILPQIGDLINLIYLDLSDQGFTGNIPSELWNLVNLETLYLSNNPELTGSIPPEIGNLTSLINLDLSMGDVSFSHFGEGKIGNLNGEIPSQIGQLTNLELLDISVCQISGPIPSEIGNLVNLKTLKLNGYPVNTVQPGYGSDQSNPGGIGNSLSGSIPPEIGNLASLELLDLSSNNLDGSLPEELWNLASLTNLNLTNNQLSGNLSAGIENLQSLEFIDIDRNYFEGDLPIEIFNLNALKRLSISANQFSGEIPGEISNLSNLEALHIDNNHFSGEIPAGICNMNIWDGYGGLPIKINSNEFCPPYPSCVANYDPDTDNAWYNNYSNPGDQYCEQCESNYAYDGECVEQSEMDFLQSMIDNSSETINMHFDANINGLIEPFELDCEWDGGRITIAHLDRMGLSGEIPVSIGDLESIQDIILYGNQLTGTIPPEIGNLEGLTNLKLSSNQLTGSIPPEIGNLEGLTNLGLQGNQLTGSIPSEIGNLLNIGNNYGSINLSNNQLTGYVPESICNLNTDNIYLTNNNLCPLYPSCLEDDNVGEQETSNCDLVSILDDGLPIAFNLYNAYPNPFNPVTTLRYDLPEPSNVNIIIYDMLGRQVKTLINQNQDAGHKSIRWNATNDYGKPVGAGVYLYRIQAGNFRQTKKMVLLK